jgi:hypothetical protein
MAKRGAAWAKTVTGTATYRRPQERGESRTVLSYSTTRVGSTTTTVGERSRTCEVDVTETFDPATGSFTITGLICGQTVNVTRGPGLNTRDG